jgi:ferredoxin--NADP+ reductase
MQIYWTKINQIIEESPEVKTYMLDLPEGFTWEEGAHTHFALKGFNAGDKPNKGMVRHMSISTLPEEQSIGITTRIRKECSPFKSILRDTEVGSNVALFKTHSNVPLLREDKPLYLLSSGVGLATFRPLVMDYLKSGNRIPHMHSLTIDSAKDNLFSTVFTSQASKNFTATKVDERNTYYEEVKNLAQDKNGIFYLVGSDEFLLQNIDVLQSQGIKQEQIMLDKREQQLSRFFTPEVSV